MDQEKRSTRNHFERGSAGSNLVILIVAFVLVGHAGINYVPVAYEAEDLKQEMQTSVVQGMAPLPGQRPVDLVRDKLKRVIASSDVPANTFVQVTEVNQVIHATVKYTKRVNILPFGIIHYDYVFDHTTTPAGFMIQ